MKKGISQEGLKLIACLTMLIDHIGYEIIYPLYAATFVVHEGGTLYNMYLLCRMVGRISFPIFAFLLVEGIHRSRDRKKYALRLVIGAVLAEIPYDLVVSGQMFWRQQSVMLTLLLGFCAVLAMERCPSLSWKPVAALPFAVLAEVLMTDYGWTGIVLMVLFELSREMYSRNFIRTVGMVVLFHYTSGMVLQFGNLSVPMQVLGALSMLFIANYDGRKRTYSKAAQWGFYLFYPAHLLVLWILGGLLSGMLLSGAPVVI